MSADLGVWPCLEVSNLNCLGKDMTVLPLQQAHLLCALGDKGKAGRDLGLLMPSRQPGTLRSICAFI